MTKTSRCPAVARWDGNLDAVLCGLPLGHAGPHQAEPAPAQPTNPHGWTDQPNYRYPCCLGSPQEGHKPHCEAASQPVEDAPDRHCITRPDGECVSDHPEDMHRLEAAIESAKCFQSASLKKGLRLDRAMRALEEIAGMPLGDHNAKRVATEALGAALSSVEDSAPKGRTWTQYKAEEVNELEAKLVKVEAELTRANAALQVYETALGTVVTGNARAWSQWAERLLWEAKEKK